MAGAKTTCRALLIRMALPVPGARGEPRHPVLRGAALVQPSLG